MGWTKQQQRAIDERGKSLLVSAAAGSGKTAVMVERITRMITEENYSIDEMLIVTFTNAAASEMREKIRRAMKGKARENPGMRRQLDLLPRANISTFHAFAMEVIRRFFYLTDLEPSFRILDEDRSTILREEALDELLDACYEEGDPDFLRFMDRYSGEKDDDSYSGENLKTIISQTGEGKDAVILEFEAVLPKGNKDEIMEKHAVLKCRKDEASKVSESLVVYSEIGDYGAEILVNDRHSAEKLYPDMVIENAALEEIMIYYVNRNRSALGTSGTGR